MPEAATIPAFAWWYWYYPFARDAIITLIGGGLVYLLYTDRSFLRNQFRTLLDRQQALEQEAVTQKAYTDRLLALLDHLSPQRLLEQLKATREFLEESRDVELAAYRRKLEERAQEIARDTDAQKTKAELWETRAKTGARLLSEALFHLGLTLRLHPKVVREKLLGWVKDDTVRTQTEYLVKTLEEKFGPSPADKSPYAMLPYFFPSTWSNELARESNSQEPKPGAKD
jgi:hypothetical protein